MITPVDCDLTQTCYIQQYMDRDPGPNVRDYRCETLANDGHRGTDFALPSLNVMAEGVSVVAAAPGVVKGIRDGMPDTGRTAENAASLQGRECGNGVRIDHANGWTTQYCHLRQGSVSVREGQHVNAGDPLGLVGKSGSATFPHLHFGLRRFGDVIDPFNPSQRQTCATDTNADLWQDPLPYRAGGLIAIGLFERIPKYSEVKQGSAQLTALSRDLPVLAFWSYSFGTRADDVLRLSLTGPDGTLVAKDITMDKPQALSMRAIGKKRRAKPWTPGAYTGTATLIRAGKAIETRTMTLHMP